MNLSSIAAAVATAALLAGCVVETAPEQSAPSTPQAQQPAPPAVGFSPDVSSAAVSNCRNTLDAQTDGAIEVTGTESSEANDAVYMVVGQNRAPWRCLVSRDARVQELMFIGTEGKL